LHVEAAGAWRRPEAGSLEEFVVEHYWGYTRQPDGECLEYRVAHPPWSIRCVTHAELDCDAQALYGPALGGALSCPAESAFLAEGSRVSVHCGCRARVARLAPASK
jgi:hypothetical protein